MQTDLFGNSFVEPMKGKQIPMFHEPVNIERPDNRPQVDKKIAAKFANCETPTMFTDIPAIEQYRQYKATHPDYVIFFHIGDFYETFYEDAYLCQRVLGIALNVSPPSGPAAVPRAGVPFHAVEQYLRKMIAAGHKVALCEAKAGTK